VPQRPKVRPVGVPPRKLARSDSADAHTPTRPHAAPPVPPTSEPDDDFLSAVWKLLCSVKLAIVLLVFITLACIFATTLCRSMGAAKALVYRTWWFDALLALLAANLACCTVHRWRFRFRQTGFLLTHLSIIVVLIGGLIGSRLGERGHLDLWEGDTGDAFVPEKETKRIKTATKGHAREDVEPGKPLGFALRLDKFVLEKYGPDYSVYVQVGGGSKPKEFRFDPKPGVRQKVRRTSYAIEVVEQAQNAYPHFAAVNKSSQPHNPAIELELRDGAEPFGAAWLEAKKKDRSSFFDKPRGLRVSYVWCSTEESYASQQQSVDEPVREQLVVTIPKTGVQKEFEVKVGQEITIPEGPVRLKILRYEPDFVIGHEGVTSRSAEPNNPALQVEALEPAGGRPQWLFAKMPDFGMTHGGQAKDVQLRYTHPGQDAQAKEHLKIVHAHERPPVLVVARDQKLFACVPFKVGEALQVPGAAYTLKVATFYPDKGEVMEVRTRSEAPTSPAARVKVFGPRGEREFWLFALEPFAHPAAYDDGQLHLVYAETREDKDYKSTLTVLENGQPVLNKTIEVNDPLTYKGYAFYQARYAQNPETGKFQTGLQVVRDPGLPVIYVGFTLLVLGVVFALYVKPFLKVGERVSE